MTHKLSDVRLIKLGLKKKINTQIKTHKTLSHKLSDDMNTSKRKRHGVKVMTWKTGKKEN